MPPQIQTKTVSVTNTRLAVATLALISAAALAFAAIPTTFNNVDVCEQQDNGVVLYGMYNSVQTVQNYCADGNTLVTVQCNPRLGSDRDTTVVINKKQPCGGILNGSVCSNGEGCVCGPGYTLGDDGSSCVFLGPAMGCKDTDRGKNPKIPGNVLILGPDGGPTLYTIKDYCINDTTLIEGVCRDGVYQAAEVNCGQEGFACNSDQRACVQII
ncbi:MAG: hypothetical protein HOL80_01290 [Candidatus Magasanikbacteria bacterium]|jgi:hypothetical protein|nr:hypothetical protein [Candidatus Magasanikbacteria bacterium]MBT5262516.1 hypothetical protein [Candidatus Magasanikbacteria bacterium]MBT6294209.1 hypothetical protein [Candidatus Magasanikbacteria bacterium]